MGNYTLVIWMALLFSTGSALGATSLPVAEFFRRAEASRTSFPDIPEDAQVDVVYMEYVLTSWVLEGNDWNAYHSGIGFNVRTPGAPDKKFHVEFVPRLTHDIRHVLIPQISYPENKHSWLPNVFHDFCSWLTSDYVLEWQNEGAVFFTDFWPKKYKNFTMVGTTSGRAFNQMRPWLFEYQDKHRTFEPVEILSQTGEVLHPSHLCHDLFYHALDRLHELGLQSTPEAPIFRDHIVLFSSKMRKATFGDDKREIVRFFRLYESFIHLINYEFSSIRSMFLGAYLLTIKPFLYKEGEYFELEIDAPYVNYCYMEVVMPPGKKASLFENEKLCALGDFTTEVVTTFAFNLSPHHGLLLFESAISDWRFLASLAMILLSLWFRRVYRINHARTTHKVAPSVSRQ